MPEGTSAGIVTQSSHRGREGARDHVLLLLAGQRVKAHRIARDADGELRIFLGMLHGIQQGLAVEHVDVQILTALVSLMPKPLLP